MHGDDREQHRAGRERERDEPEGDGAQDRSQRSARRAAREAGLEDDGYRIVINNGPHGGESVPHLHLHVLGGRPMG
ncbi:MAG: HIT domain-containing protein, partial [Elioraea tepidiphila]